MSEMPPEQGPPLNPDELRRLAEIASKAGNMPDFTEEAITTITGLHARWYFSWQRAGIPEHRAAEWAGIMIATQFRALA